MMDLQQICDEVQREWGLGGLSGGLYGDYAKEVARRAVAAEREACAQLCENNDMSWADDVWNEAVRDCAAKIRARSNVKED